MSTGGFLPVGGQGHGIPPNLFNHLKAPYLCNGEEESSEHTLHYSSNGYFSSLHLIFSGNMHMQMKIWILSPLQKE